jgi:hypothetical protein
MSYNDLTGYQGNDAIQRSLNEAKKQELNEKYGMSWGDSESKLDPEIESEFLNYVEEFERAYEGSEVTTVWEYLGKPELIPIEGLTLQEMERELRRIYAIMEENQMALDCINKVDIRELYEFVSGDFMKVECDDIRISGMMTRFIYEEFFPESSQ